mmetsp:Transcript_98946/g.319071  ORF Transcript_98946/g.319071 Transcript_98946/m.319071 type:complete len:231 (-) Transcript_98946:1113-1805(-)
MARACLDSRPTQADFSRFHRSWAVPHTRRRNARWSSLQHVALSSAACMSELASPEGPKRRSTPSAQSWGGGRSRNSPRALREWASTTGALLRRRWSENQCGVGASNAASIPGSMRHPVFGESRASSCSNTRLSVLSPKCPSSDRSRSAFFIHRLWICPTWPASCTDCAQLFRSAESIATWAGRPHEAASFRMLATPRTPGTAASAGRCLSTGFTAPTMAGSPITNAVSPS